MALVPRLDAEPDPQDDLFQRMELDRQKLLAGDAALNFNRFQHDALHGEQGLFTLQGEAAVQHRAPLIQALQEKRQHLTDDLKNPAARQYFFNQVTPQLDRELTRIHQFADEQQTVWDRQSRQTLIDALIGNAISAGVRDGQPDIDEIRLQADLADIEIVDAARQDGVDATEVETRRQAARSTIHSGIVDRLLDADALPLARAYLDANKDRFSETDHRQIAAHLQDREITSAATRAADNLWQRAGADLPTIAGEELSTLDRQLAATLAQLETLPDGEQYQRARSHIIHRHRQALAAARTHRRSLWGGALSAVLQGTAADHLPVATRLALGGESMSRLRRIASTGGHHETSTDGHLAIARLLDLADHDFVETDISEYADRLSRRDQRRLTDRQTLVRKQLGGDDSEYDPLNATVRQHLERISADHQMDGLGQRGIKARIMMDVADALVSANRVGSNQPEQVIEDAVTQSAQRMRRSYTLSADARNFEDDQMEHVLIQPDTRRHLIRLYMQQTGRAPNQQQIAGIIKDWMNAGSV